MLVHITEVLSSYNYKRVPLAKPKDLGIRWLVFAKHFHQKKWQRSHQTAIYNLDMWWDG